MQKSDTIEIAAGAERAPYLPERETVGEGGGGSLSGHAEQGSG